MSRHVTRAERRLLKHERSLLISLAWASAAALAIYLGIIGRASGGPFNRIESAGWGNIALAIAFLALTSQIAIVTRASPIEKRIREDENLAAANRVLEVTVRLLKQRKPKVTYRAILTIYDPATDTRRTVGGANYRIDPESTLVVPANWGVAGEAFEKNRLAASDIPDDLRGRDPSGVEVAQVWVDVRSVVAFPLLTGQPKRPTGTVNFDADHFLKEAGLDQREMLDALSEVADVVSGLMERGDAEGG